MSIVDITLAACWHGGHAPRAMNDMTVRNADLSLRDLRVLDVLLRERSLTRAAEQLGTTQPSISKVLARLRTRFGDPLLTRSGQEMHPTPRALEIERPLRGLLLSADVLDRSTPAFAPATSDRIFKLLLSDVGMVIFLPPLTRRLAQEGARLRVHAVPLDSAAFRFEARIRRGRPGARRLHHGGTGLAASAALYGGICRRGACRPSATIFAGPAARRAGSTPHHRHGFRHRPCRTSHRAGRDRGCGGAGEHPAAPAELHRRGDRRSASDASPPSRRGSRRSSPDRSASQPSSRRAATSIEITQYWHERYHRDPGHRWLRSGASTCSAGRAGLSARPAVPSEAKDPVGRLPCAPLLVPSRCSE